MAVFYKIWKNNNEIHLPKKDLNKQIIRPIPRTPFNESKIGKKVKSYMARSLPVENLLPQNVESIINYLQ